MATSRVERLASDTFDWMADKWGAYQHPGADMPITRGKRGLNTDYGVPPGLVRPADYGVPPGIAQPTEFGVPPGIAQPRFEMGGGGQMSRDELEKMMKQQEMMEQFKRMIAARRHAAMNP